MKIKRKFGELFILYVRIYSKETSTDPFLQKLIHTNISNPYVAYKIQRILKSLRDYGEDLARQQNLLVEKYGTPILDKDGKDSRQKQVLPSNLEKYNEYQKELKSFLGQEDEFEFEYLLTLSDLKEFEPSANNIDILNPILDQEKIKTEIEIEDQLKNKTESENQK